MSVLEQAYWELDVILTQVREAIVNGMADNRNWDFSMMFGNLIKIVGRIVLLDKRGKLLELFHPFMKAVQSLEAHPMFGAELDFPSPYNKYWVDVQSSFETLSAYVCKENNPFDTGHDIRLYQTQEEFLRSHPIAKKEWVKYLRNH